MEDHGAVDGYRWACDHLGLEADSNVWGFAWAEPRLREAISDADWEQIYGLIEQLTPDSGMLRSDFGKRVNDTLAQEGLAYEFKNGKFYPFDPLASEVQVAEVPDNALAVLTGRLRPAGEQFERAIAALRGRPLNAVGAIGEATNAAEAVAKILSSMPNATFGPALDALFARRNSGHDKALTAGMKSLYGYSSQLPGARHGQHVTVDVSYAEAALTVNLMGSLILFLVSEFESNPDMRE